VVTAAKAKPGSKVKIHIPRYQRGLVWSKEQREKLVDSLFRGYPIGAIMLHQTNDSDGSSSYLLVDGLQRTSTLVTYQERPLAWAPAASVVPSDDLDDLVAELRTVRADAHVEPELVLEAIEAWMKSTGTLKQGDGYTPDALFQRLRSALVIESVTEADRSRVIGKIAVLLDNLEEEVRLESAPLPVIIFRGHESQLPEVFERVNRQGTKLNRYELLASTWSDDDTAIASSTIKKNITDKYTALTDRGYSIDGFDPGSSITDFTLFEYLFGLGKSLEQNHPSLFRSSEDPTDTPATAFVLATVMHGLRLPEMRELPKAMGAVARTKKGLIDPVAFERAVLESAEFVDQSLRPYIGLSLNKRSGGASIAHAEYQIISLIARTALARYDSASGWQEKASWKTDQVLFRTAIPQHYLHDIVRTYWRGPLETLLFDRVWRASDAGLVLASEYVTPVGRERLDAALETWFDGQLHLEQRTRQYVTEAAKLVLKYVYASIVTHKDEHAVTFELDHILPVARIVPLIPAHSAGWPISCVANLALFPQAVNRSKSTLTVGEYVADAKVDASVRKTVENYMISPAGDAVIPTDEEGNSCIDLECYREFLINRWAALKATVLKSVLQ